MEQPPQSFKEVYPRDEEALEHLDKLKDEGFNVIANALESLRSERFNRLEDFLNRQAETMYSFKILAEKDVLSLVDEYSNADETELDEIEEKIEEMLA